MGSANNINTSYLQKFKSVRQLKELITLCQQIDNEVHCVY